MGRSHIEQEALQELIDAAQQQVTVGALYQHYKSPDKIYKIIELGFIEADDTLCVIYQAQYGKRLTFIRPLTIWLETVQWDGQTVPRFTKIN